MLLQLINSVNLKWPMGVIEKEKNVFAISPACFPFELYEFFDFIENFLQNLLDKEKIKCRDTYYPIATCLDDQIKEWPK